MKSTITQMLQAIIDELLGKDPKYTGWVAQAIHSDTLCRGISYRPGLMNYRLEMGYIGRKAVSFVYGHDDEVPFLYHQITGKVPDGYTLVNMDPDIRVKVAKGISDTALYDKDEGWMQNELVNYGDIRHISNWWSLTDRGRTELLNKHYPGSPKQRPVDLKAPLFEKIEKVVTALAEDYLVVPTEDPQVFWFEAAGTFESFDAVFYRNWNLANPDLTFNPLLLITTAAGTLCASKIYITEWQKTLVVDDDTQAFASLIGDLSEGLLRCSYNDADLFGLWLAGELDVTFNDLDVVDRKRFLSLVGEKDMHSYCELLGTEDISWQDLVTHFVQKTEGWPQHYNAGPVVKLPFLEKAYHAHYKKAKLNMLAVVRSV